MRHSLPLSSSPVADRSWLLLGAAAPGEEGTCGTQAIAGANRLPVSRLSFALMCCPAYAGAPSCLEVDGRREPQPRILSGSHVLGSSGPGCRLGSPTTVKVKRTCWEPPSNGVCHQSAVGSASRDAQSARGVACGILGWTWPK